MALRRVAAASLAGPSAGARRATASVPALGLALLWALALLAAPGCGKPAGKSLVIITLDTTRADHLGCYGYPLPTSPNIDALAKQGVLFEQAYAPMPQTLPSHATLFTGLPPRRHKALENAHILAPDITTLAEMLSDRDYETAAFIGARVLDDSTGMQRGFSVFDMPTGKARDVQHPVERRGDAVTDSALSWALARHFAAKPFLMWVHYYDPHGPYEAREQRIALDQVEPLVRRQAEFKDLAPQELHDVAAIQCGYDNELAYMDAQVGKLLHGLRQRKMLDDAIVVVVGDHGEGLMEHGEKSHGATIYQELMLVPLIIVLPDGSRAGTRVKAPVQMQDLLPTLLDLACLAGTGGGAAGGLPGVDLSAAVRLGNEPAPRPIVFERPYYTPEGIRGGRALAHGWGFGELAGVVVGDEKLIRLPPDETGTVKQQLFDLKADPDELRDIAGERPEAVARLSALLDEWLARYPVKEDEAAPTLTPEREEDLRRLGYLGGQTVSETRPEVQPEAQPAPEPAPEPASDGQSEPAPSDGRAGGH